MLYFRNICSLKRRLEPVNFTLSFLLHKILVVHIEININTFIEATFLCLNLSDACVMTSVSFPFI